VRCLWHHRKGRGSWHMPPLFRSHEHRELHQAHAYRGLVVFIQKLEGQKDPSAAPLAIRDQKTQGTIETINFFIFFS